MMTDNRTLLSLAFIAVLLSCSRPFTINYELKKVDKITYVDSYPIVFTGEDSFLPVCSPDDPIAQQFVKNGPTGYAVNFEVNVLVKKNNNTKRDVGFQGQPVIRTAGNTTGREKVVVLDEKDNLSADAFNVNLKCLRSLHDSKLHADCTDGVKNPSPPVRKVARFYSYFHDCIEPTGPGQTKVCPHHNEKGDIGVIFLFDNSGSMDGVVDVGVPGDPSKPKTYQETDLKAIAPGNNQDYATDNNWSAREQVLTMLFAASSHMEPLFNRNYKMLVARFAEGTNEGTPTFIKAACKVPKNMTSQKDIWNYCFGVNRSLYSETALKTLPKGMTIAKGRTPLWAAVMYAYDFLKQQIEKGSIKVGHVIVVDDSPDTCSKQSPYYNWKYDSACGDSTYNYSNLRAEVMQQLQANGDTPVHLDFIQIQSLGYMERDPQQMEMACLTRGHYVFLNARQWSPANYNVKLAAALKAAMRGIVNMLDGYWQLAFEINDLSNVPKGTYAALAGDISVNTNIDNAISITPMSMELDPMGPKNVNDINFPKLDTRSVIRLFCTDNSQCKQSNTNSEAPKSLDNSCVMTGCVQQLGLCHWSYKGDGAQCGGGNTCQLGKCEKAE